MRWSEFVDEVRERGQYATAKEAERITRIVLSALGGHVTGPERAELARRLPPEAAMVVTGQLPAVRPQTAAEFVEGVARRIDGAAAATVRWDVGSVLSVVADLAGDGLLDRVLRRLPPGYALLFGRAQLTGTVPAPAPASAVKEDREGAAQLVGPS
ncbi:DUF2267 domain-containing protein [Streptantibioticus ferralitis]|uniref:DUF2267 domain-containing protein n=1 Tax=Streptantibioticus ferralitis TaxID=236510 RepID=A0ABT5Z3Q9_9ACTN|nr:DUF2267 domain-containing protein [Streptantibioticus ferralitis]MDF2258460.1 DUF2267 domain-containing protein [Streptantibioticus ferralitis]